MQTRLSNRTQLIQEAAMATMGNLSRKLKAQGADIVTLSLGEPDFNTPDFIKQAAHNAIDQNFSHYSPLPGFADLRQAIAHKLQRDNNLIYKPEQIIVSTGAKQSIMNALFALLNDGDEVLLPAPYWASYYDMILLAGGIPRVINTTIEDGFKITEKHLETSISDKTKLLIFNSPNNPSGAFYSKDEVKQIAAFLKNHPSIFILSDDVYEFFVYKNEKPLSMAKFPELFERTILINGISKSFAMTGWRLGYMAAHQDIARACDIIQGQITSGANSITQRAALVAIEKEPQDIPEIAYMRNEFRKRRDFVFSYLQKLPKIKTILPEGAFYIFPDISGFFGKKFQNQTINNSFDFAILLLNEAHVSTTPGVAFGVDNCLRLSYANSLPELEKAMNRLSAFVEKLT